MTMHSLLPGEYPEDPPPYSIIHCCPPGDEALTPCCRQTLFEISLMRPLDRVTLDQDLVTCGGVN